MKKAVKHTSNRYSSNNIRIALQQMGENSDGGIKLIYHDLFETKNLLHQFAYFLDIGIVLFLFFTYNTVKYVSTKIDSIIIYLSIYYTALHFIRSSIVPTRKYT